VVWIVIAVAFAAVWTYAFYREDGRNPEPKWLVGLCVLAGMAAVPIAIKVEGLLAPDPAALYDALRSRLWLAMAIAGPVEEFAKFVAVAVVVWFQPNFDEPIDGIVYAGATGAGFALVENFLFMQDDPSSILARAPAATGAHILFAALWGGALGHAKHVRRTAYRFGIMAVGLTLGSICHGMFDLATWSAGRGLTANQARVTQVLLMVGCALFVRWRIRVALESSPPTAIPLPESHQV
jgi:RsiW-degrading membrane proteinase PrsW (M82 family)